MEKTVIGMYVNPNLCRLMKTRTLFRQGGGCVWEGRKIRQGVNGAKVMRRTMEERIQWQGVIRPYQMEGGKR